MTPKSPLSPRKPAVSSSANDTPADETPSKAFPRALPHPVETTSTSSSNRKALKQDGGEKKEQHASRDRAVVGITSNTARPLPQPIESTASSTKSRRFTPQMVETTRRSRRNTDTSIGMIESDKTDHLPPPQHCLPPHLRTKVRPSLQPIPPDNSPIISTYQIPQVSESKFSSSKLAEKAPRRHSFRIPDLPAIKSTSGTEEDSNFSDVPSLTPLPSADSDRVEHNKRKRKPKQRYSARESQNENFSGYLLALAASAAEKQLRDQAMAAYPNEHVHEPVDHYAVDRDSEGSDMEVHVGRLEGDGPAYEEGDPEERARRYRRESAAGWDMAEMRQHQERLEQQRQDAWASSQLETPPGLSRRRSIKANLAEAGPSTPQAAVPPKEILGWQKDNEITSQRKAASPPMAGEDLRFPKCLSPQATRMDVHQYPGTQKITGTETRQRSGLWTPRGGASRKSSQSGLWMGVNAASAQLAQGPPRTIQTGLLTPSGERSDPFSGPLATTITTPTPRTSHPSTLQPPSKKN
ncbi:MAG: hypothetical protein Q9217_005848 [Psora testacea]